MIHMAMYEVMILLQVYVVHEQESELRYQHRSCFIYM